jgi:periplasmic protein TonB
MRTPFLRLQYLAVVDGRTRAQERFSETRSRSVFFSFIVLGHMGFFWSLNVELTANHSITIHDFVELAPQLAAETIPRLPPPPIPMDITFAPPSVDQPVVIFAETDAAAAQDAFIPDAEPSTTESREESRQISPPASNPLQPLTSPLYPPISQRLNEEGRVILEVYVLDNGRVADATVLKSSGYARLDQAALEEVKRGWRLLPGTEDGKPTAMWVRLAVRFRLNKGG